MPKSIEEIEVLFNKATSEDKMQYLFLAIKHVGGVVQVLSDNCACRVVTCERQLADRKAAYDKTYLSKRQAKIIGTVAVFLTVAYSLGVGFITWKEALSLVKP